ncbi:polysaccharide deacetylase family protein [Allobaculum mucilyticum]|uniref:polysaccharide deacetylase family protein n=1 Tax=Allobaculum mucilyticum TaxID=2834459 RepID=UPI001E64CB66|nr:polysaccharide deacetylase family protein [Allobaculum mucilyticum]UNT97305.1 polysaccharide deacetylase [Allobaculum mucilyticum]
MSDSAVHTPTHPKSNLPKKKKKLRIGRIVLLLVILAAVIGGGWFLYKTLNPITLVSDTYVAQYGQPFDSKANLADVFMDSKDRVVFEGDVDTSVVSTTQCLYRYKGKEYPFTVSVRDTEGPQLEVQDVTISTNENLTPENFVVSVADPSNYTLKIAGDDPDGKPGTYTIQVMARDNYDNTTIKTATLTRYADTEAPEIENFSDKLTLLQGNDYPTSSIVLKDDYDPSPNLYISTEHLNTTEPGQYPVSMTTTDRSGNSRTYEQTVTVEANPDYGKKFIYLTFDDGPSEVTPRILDTLSANGVTATFFVTGAYPDYYGLMKDILDQGSEIALHTYSHNYSELYSSEDAYFEDLQAISDLVKKETGYTAHVIRFPGGSSNSVSAQYSQGIMSKLVNEVEDRGYAYFDWNSDSGDASGNNVDPQIIIEKSCSSIGSDNVVILMHDAPAKSTTADALDTIIKRYKEAGYEFRNLSVDTPPVHHTVTN